MDKCPFVRCLMIDFSKAFDLGDHPILLAELVRSGLPNRAINWIISYLTGRIQAVKCNGKVSADANVNTGSVQWSGIGPMLFVMASDLHTLSNVNVLMKYADDTNLLVPTYSDLELAPEFDNVKQWATQNRMVINLQKNKQISGAPMFTHCH